MMRTRWKLSMQDRQRTRQSRRSGRHGSSSSSSTWTASRPAKRLSWMVDVSGRIQLVDCAAEEMRKVPPLSKNGPDPVIDRDVLTPEWLAAKLKSKKVPVKALLLDQGNISGSGELGRR
ncbi:hypothetical protein MRB53_037358 [Persea americana]|nr:hypothetical protein MRB53_037358 [Persea americana]